MDQKKNINLYLTIAWVVIGGLWLLNVVLGLHRGGDWQHALLPGLACIVCWGVAASRLRLWKKDRNKK